MRTNLLAIACTAAALSGSRAQSATITGRVFAREAGTPLGGTTVSVLAQGMQLLTSDSGSFTVRNLPSGEVRIRLRRIGFAPKDTTVTIADNDNAQLKLELTRLAIQLPAMVINGKCTNQAPLEEKPAILAELFDQVRQNAEQVKVLTKARPFLLKTVRIRGLRTRDKRVLATHVDTVERTAMPPDAYVPRRVLGRGEGVDAALWVVRLPELPDFADTAFTNNHCFQYAGQTRFESDSVIRVDFEPVPWLSKDVDIQGSIYLLVDGYQLVAMEMKLNRMPSQFRAVREFSVRARFTEFITGVPVLADWELTNTFRNSSTPPRVEIGQVMDFKWLDTLKVKRDTTSRDR